MKALRARPSHLLALIGIVLLFACKGTRSLTGESVKPLPRMDAADLYEIMNGGRPNTSFSATGRFRASNGDSRVSTTIQLRMHKDSVIWASFEKLGFEVARLMITKDSVFTLNRINREFSKRSFRSFVDEYRVPLAFTDLQSALTGRLVYLVPVQLRSSRVDGYDVLKVSDGDGVQGQYRITTTLPRYLSHSILTDALGREVHMRYDKWNASGDHLLPHECLLVISDSESFTEVSMSFSEITVDQPFHTPFNVPSRYVRID